MVQCSPRVFTCVMFARCGGSSSGWRSPGSLTGRYPVGNTGRARVPATQPMPIREDLADLLRGAGR
jgi:hypothetical protein